MSRSIDEKVVSMHFDNDDFEKNVKESLSTLEKLKSGLHAIENNTTSLDNLSKSIKNVNLDGLGEAASAVSSKFSVMGTVADQVIRDMTQKIEGLIGKFYNFSLGGILNGGLSRSMKLEDAQFKLSGTLKKAEDLKAVMDSVKYGVADTAYSLDAAATVAAQLVASGLKGGEQMNKVLRGISGVAAMTSSTYEDIGSIYTTIAGNGKVMTQQLRQLSSRGLNAAATLGKALGKTEEEIYQMTTKGQIDFKTFANAMDDAFGEHAKEANKTFQGAMANLRSAFAKIGADFYTPLIKNEGPIVGLINSVREKVNAIREVIQPTVIAVSETIGRSIDKITGFISGIKTSNLQAFSDIISKSGVNTSKLYEELKKLAKGTGMEAMITKYGNFDELLKSGNLSASMLAQGLRNVSKEAKSTTDNTAQLQAKLKKFQKVVDEVWYGTYMNAPYRYDLLRQAGYDPAYVQNLVNLTEHVKDHKLSLEMLGEKQLKAIGYTEDEIKAINELADELDRSGSSMAYLMANIGKPTALEAFLSAMKRIGEFAVKVGMTIKDAFLDSTLLDNGIGISLRNLANAFSDLTKGLEDDGSRLGKVKIIFTNVFNALDSVIELFLDVLGITIKTTDDSKSVFGLLADVILDVLVNVTNVVAAFAAWTRKVLSFEKVTESGLYRALVKVVGGVSDWIRANVNLNYILSGIIGVISKLIEMFGSWGSKIYSLIVNSKTLTSAWEKIKDVANSLKKVFTGTKDSIEDVNKQTEKSKGIFEKIIDVIDKVKSSVDKFLDSLQKVEGFSFNKALGEFINFEKTAEESTDSVASKVTELPKKMMNKLLDSDLSSDGLAASVFKPIQQVFDDYDSGFMGIGNSFGENIAKAMTSGTMRSTEVSFKDLLQSLSRNFVKMADQANLGDVIAMGVFGTVFSQTGRMIAVIETLAYNLTEPVANILDGFYEAGIALKGVFTNLNGTVTALKLGMTKLIKAKTMQAAATAFLMLAGSILMLAVAVKVMSEIDPTAIGYSAAAIGVLIGTMSYLSKVMGQLTAKEIVSMSGMFISIGILLGLVAGCLWIISKIDVNAGAVWSFVGVIAVIGAVVAGLLLVSKMDGNSSGLLSASAMMSALGATLIMVSIALRIMGTLDKGQVDNGVKVIWTLGILVSALLFLSALLNMNKTDVLSIGGFFMMIGSAMVTVALAIKIIGGISKSNINKAIGTLTMVGVLLGIFMAISKVAGQYAWSAGLMFMGFAAAVGILAFAIASCLMISQRDIDKAIQIILSVSGVFVALTLVSKMAGKHAWSAGLMFMGFATSIGILVYSIRLCNSITQSDINKAISIVNGVSALMVGLTVVSAFSGQYANRAGMALIQASMGLLLIGVAISLLASLPDQDAVQNATICMIGIMAMMVLMEKYVDGFSGVGWDAKRAFNQFAISLLMVSAALGILAMLPTDRGRLLEAAASISILGIAMAAMAASFNKLPKDGPKYLGQLFALTAVILAIGSLFIAMSMLNTQGALENAFAISLVLFTLTHSLNALNDSRSRGFADFKGLLKLVAVMAIIGVVLEALTYVANKFDINNMIEVAASVSLLITAIAAAMTLMSLSPVLANNFAGTAIAANFAKFAAVVTVLVSVITALMYVAGYLDESYNVLEKVQRAIPILQAVAEGLGVFVGTLVGSLAGSMLSSFDKQIFQGISDVMNIINDFPEINKDATSTITDMGELLKAVYSVSKINKGNVTSDDFAAIGEVMTAVSSAVKDFNADLQGIENFDVGKLDIVVKIVTSISELSKALPKDGGLWQDIVGHQDLGAFADSFDIFADDLQKFCDKVNDLNYDEGKFQNAIACGTALSDLVNSLPNQGGWADTILGSNDLATFGKTLPEFGRCIIGFNNEINANGVPDLNKDLFAKIKDCTLLLADIIDALPNQGGWADTILGSNDLATFGNTLPEFGSALVIFNQTIGQCTFDPSKWSDVKTCVDSLVELSNALPDNGGLLDMFTGSKVSMTEFGQDLVSFGTYLKLFMISMSSGGFSGGAMSATTGSLEQAQATIAIISDLMNSLPKEGGLKSLVSGDASLSRLASGIEEFRKACMDFSSIDASGLQGVMKTITTSFDGIEEVTSKVKNFGETIVNTLETTLNSADMSPVVQTLIEGILTTMQSFEGEFTTEGQTLADNFAKGMGNQASYATATGSATRLGTSAKNALSSASSGSYQIGYYFTVGFANGIGNSGAIGAVIASATNVASTALSTVRNVTKVQSPSREMYAIGAFFTQGMALGIMDKTSVRQTMSNAMELAKTAIDTASEQLANIDDHMELSPVITPVVDWSNMGGADFGKINVPGVSKLQNKSSFSASMRDEIIRSNNKVIDAITGLNDNLYDYINSPGPEVAMYVDGRKLASSIAKPMDQQLATLAKRRR